MHYKNGRKVKIGDRLVARTSAGVPFLAMYGGYNSPDGKACVFPLPTNDQLVSMEECLHVDDALRPAPVRASRKRRRT